jgi:gamma-glutamyltranspeptidase
MGGTLMAIGLSLREPPPPAEFPFRKRDDWLHWIEPLRLMSLLRNGNPGQTLSSGEQSLLRATLQAHPDLRDALSILLPEMLPHLRSQGTTQISVMDSAGNAISMTTSNGAGSAVIPRGTGFMMNNMLGEEDLQPAGPDTWEPGRRLASMMAPVIAQLPDGARVVSGSGGSNRIRSTLLQILRHLVDRRSSLEEAVLAPRLHWENNQLHAETEAFPALPPNLEDPVIEHPIPNLFFGGAHSVGTDSLGRLHGTADPRRGGAVERVRAGQRRR